MILGDLAWHRVAILGLAFKPHTDDLRYSPALALAATLLDRGARVVAHDPAVTILATANTPELERAETVRETIQGAELVILATEWPEYAACDWRELAGHAQVPLLYDGRNALEVDRLTTAGWTVLQVGHAASHAARTSPHGTGIALYAAALAPIAAP
jgi:UDPglucose 6-dehydrogenase